MFRLCSFSGREATRNSDLRFLWRVYGTQCWTCRWGFLWIEACLPGPLIACKLCFAGTNTYFSSPGNHTPPTKQKVSNSGFMGFNTNQSFPAVLSQLHPESQRKQQAIDHHAQPVSRPSPFQAAHRGCSVLGPFSLAKQATFSKKIRRSSRGAGEPHAE